MYKENSYAILEYRKPKKKLGECFEKGYYFKGEFISKYKYNAIEKIRQKILLPGMILNDIKDKYPDEYNLIHREYIKSIEATKKTYQTKKPYFDKIHIRMIQNKIFNLNNRINFNEGRKKEIMKDYDNKIQKLKSEIEKLEREIRERTKQPQPKQEKK